MDSTTTDVKEELMTIYDQIKFEGRQEGRKEGRQEGRKEGRQEGHQEKRKSIVLKAFDMQYTVSEISKLTLLSEKEVTQLLQKNKRQIT